MRKLWLVAALNVIAFCIPVYGQGTSNGIRNVEYCSLFRDSELEGPIARTRALMKYSTVSRVDGEDAFFYSPGCNNPDFFAVANFSKVEQPNRSSKFFAGLAAEKQFILELDITVRLNSGLVPRFGHLSWSRSDLEVLSVHSIIDVSGRNDLAKPDHNADAPVTESAQNLSSINTTILLCFLAGADISNIDSYLMPEFIVIDAEGNRYNKSNHSELAEHGLFPNSEGYDKGSANLRDIRAVGDNYLATGNLSIENAKGHQRVLQYENTYTRKHGSFALLRSKFSKP